MPRQITVLIVEDDPMVLDVNCQYVKAVEGFQVVGTATSAQAALEEAQRLAPNLTILDVYLPDQNGIVVLQQIRILKLATDVLVVTAARDVETIQEAFRYGAVDYIVKPFRQERIRSTLSSYRHMREQLTRTSSLDQLAIDRLVRGHLAAADEVEVREDGLPKGLTGVTLKQVLQFLVRSGQAHSAEEVASALGMSRVTSRRYLEYLEKNGTLELEVRYGIVGRPTHYYRCKALKV